MLKVYVTDCGFLKERPRWEQKLGLVSEARRKKILSFHSPDDRRRSLAASLLLRIALGEEHVSYDNVHFSQGKHGKPLLEGCNFYFNVSHAGECVLCALSDQQVGADVENLHRFDGKKRGIRHIAGKCLNPQEQELLEQADQYEETLIGIWTKKESFVKMTGEGLSRALTTVDTLGENCYEQRILPGDYCAAVCTGEFCGPGIWQEVRWNVHSQEGYELCMMN